MYLTFIKKTQNAELTSNSSSHSGSYQGKKQRKNLTNYSRSISYIQKRLDEQTASVHFPPFFQLALQMLRSTSNNYIFGYSVVSSFMLARNTTIINSRVMHSIEQRS